MRFTVDQMIAAPPGSVTAALEDPAFYASLGDRGAVRAPELLEVRDEGDGRALVRVRYRFGGHLSGAAARVLDAERLTWVVESLVNRAEHTATFGLHADHYADRITATGAYRLEALDDGHSRQRVEGEVRVHYALVGALVERAIVSGLTEHLEEQARALSTYRPGA